MASKNQQVKTTEWVGDSKHYRQCAPGHPRHWGPDGAAGALAWLTCSDGETCVLLAQRSKHVQSGGTWAFPGGAIDSGEDSLSAAIRELTEEISAGAGSSLKPCGLTGQMEASCGHGCGWTYTSYVIRVRPEDGDVPFVQVARGSSAWETDDVAWWPLASVDTLELHPAFAKAWPALKAMIERAAS